MKALIFAMAVLFAAPAAASEAKTANFIHACDKQRANRVDYEWCTGFMTGYIRGANDFSQQVYGRRAMCTDGLTVDALASSLIDWVGRKPRYNNQDFGVTIFVAMLEMYGCNGR